MSLLNSNNYEEELEKIDSLRKGGKTEKEIIAVLAKGNSNDSAEEFLKLVKGVAKKENLDKLRNILVTLLLFFLITKLFDSIFLIARKEFSLMAQFILLGVVPIFNLLALFLVKKEYSYCYRIVFVMGIFGISNQVDAINMAFITQNIVVTVFVIIETIALLALLFSSAVLDWKFSTEELKIRRIIRKRGYEVGGMQ